MIYRIYYLSDKVMCDKSGSLLGVVSSDSSDNACARYYSEGGDCWSVKAVATEISGVEEICEIYK